MDGVSQERGAQVGILFLVKLYGRLVEHGWIDRKTFRHAFSWTKFLMAGWFNRLCGMCAETGDRDGWLASG